MNHFAAIMRIKTQTQAQAEALAQFSATVATLPLPLIRCQVPVHSTSTTAHLRPSLLPHLSRTCLRYAVRPPRWIC